MGGTSSKQIPEKKVQVSPINDPPTRSSKQVQVSPNNDPPKSYDDLPLPEQITLSNFETFTFEPLSKHGSQGKYGVIGNVFVKVKGGGVAKKISAEDGFISFVKEVKMLNFIKNKQEEESEGSECCLTFLGWCNGSAEWCNKPGDIFILTEKLDQIDFYDAKEDPVFFVKLLQQLCKGLQFLHKNNIAHLDLKEPNVMLDANNNLKIIDFGFARFVPKTFDRVFGTKQYMSPEMRFKDTITTKADMFSVGIFIYASITDFFPFENDDNDFRRRDAQNDFFDESTKKNLKNSLQKHNLPATLFNAIEYCLDKDPQRRKTAKFLADYLSKMLTTGTSGGESNNDGEFYHLRF